MHLQLTARGTFMHIYLPCIRIFVPLYTLLGGWRDKLGIYYMYIYMYIFYGLWPRHTPLYTTSYVCRSCTMPWTLLHSHAHCFHSSNEIEHESLLFNRLLQCKISFILVFSLFYFIHFIFLLKPLTQLHFYLFFIYTTKYLKMRVLSVWPYIKMSIGIINVGVFILYIYI